MGLLIVQPETAHSDPGIISLDLAPHLVWVEVLDLPRGMRASRSLSQLGINLHGKLRVVSAAPWGGPILVDAAGSNVAIGRTLASRIQVKLLNSDGERS
jgi:Fe2+ transport system protein FeoA